MMLTILKKWRSPVKVKILPPKTKANYVEESQNKEIFMAYTQQVGKKVFQKLHPAVLCRDYFGDAIYSEQEKKNTSIFGFSWGPLHPERVLDRDKTRLAFQSASETDFKNFKENLGILNKIEKDNGLEKTKFTEAEDEKDYQILIEGDTKWMSSIFLISLYTFLLKCMCYEIENKADWLDCICKKGTKESEYARVGKKRGLIPILKNLSRFGFDETSKAYPVHGRKTGDVNISTVHNASGWFTTLSWDRSYGGMNSYYYDMVCELVKAEK